jgi:hypothetical protein
MGDPFMLFPKGAYLLSAPLASTMECERYRGSAAWAGWLDVPIRIPG